MYDIPGHIPTAVFGHNRQRVLSVLGTHSILPQIARAYIPPGKEPSDTPSYSADMALGDAVKDLPVEYRTVVILFYYEEMSVKQISEITGLSAGAVKTRLSRARGRLKPLLDL